MFIVVSIQSRNEIAGTFSHVCTGTLISRRIVLTAAHCVQHSAVDDIIVVVGINSYMSPSIDQKYQVVSFMHPGFEHRQFAAYRDIALIQLTTCVSSPTGRFPRLAIDKDHAGTTCAKVTTVGFGRYDHIPPNLFVTDGRLRSVSENQIFHSDRVCKEAFVTYMTEVLFKRKLVTDSTRKLLSDSIDPTVGCYGGELPAVQEGYPCHGDSGGPVFDKEADKIVGVTSFSSEVCGTLPNYYTKVNGFTDWIYNQLQRIPANCEADNDLEYLNTGRKLGEEDMANIWDPLGGDELETLVDNIVGSSYGQCLEVFDNLNMAFQNSTLSTEVVEIRCGSFLECIERSTAMQVDDVMTTIQLSYPADIDTVDAPLHVKLALSRVMLCGSAFNTYYDSWHDEFQVTSNYMDRAGVKDECETLTV